MVILLYLVANTSIKKALLCSQTNIFGQIDLKPIKYHMINLDPFYHGTTYIETAINSLYNGGFL